MNKSNEHLFTEIAVIGMAGQFPMSSNLEQFWENVKTGKEMISRFSNEELKSNGIKEAFLGNPTYIKAKGIIENPEFFDADLFGYSPGEAETMDPQHRRLLECAWEALENAGYDPEQYEGSIGVFTGCNPSSYFLTNLSSELFKQSDNEMDELSLLLGNGADYLSTRISYKLNLKGPSKTIQTACSTSLVCVHDACQSLLTYQCDLALAGGVAISFPQKNGYFYTPGGINSPDGHCRAFDHRAKGTVFSDGLGIVVLKRLEEAIEDRDTILAIIKGSAINNDGADKVGFSAPSVQGQAEVIAAALAAADVSPESITYIETHGTGTHLGDPIEIAALTQAFQLHTSKKQFCAIGSLKTNVGHLVTAAGIAGLIKTILMLNYKEIPPLVNFENPNPKIPFIETPFFVNVERIPWSNEKGPLRAGVSSFGIGGTNAHIILEEAPAPSSPSPECFDQLISLSARTPETLKHLISNLCQYLKSNSISLKDAAHSLRVGRKALPFRFSTVCSNQQSLIELLELAISNKFIKVDSTSPNTIWFFSNEFDIQLDSAASLYSKYLNFRSIIDDLADLIQQLRGFKIKNLLIENANVNYSAADCIFVKFVIQLALAKLLLSWDLKPNSLDGNGIGMYVAGIIAEAISLEKGLASLSLYADALDSENDNSGKWMDLENYVNQIKLSKTSIPFVEKKINSIHHSFWFEILRQIPYSREQKNDKQTLIIQFGTTSTTQDNREDVFCFETTSSLDRSLLTIIGRLWEHGAEIDWDKISFGKALRRIPLPSYPFARKNFTATKNSALNEPFLAENNLNFTRSERIVALIWSEILKVHNFEKNDNFFMIGGDSLTALEVIDILKKVLCIEVSLQNFLINPTILQLGNIVATSINERV